MAEEEEPKGFFKQFPKLFWVVNSLELFERGAYYGTMAVLGVHIVYTLFGHLPVDTARTIWGFLYAPLIFFLYFAPLISAALAGKYGYKVVLIVAFSLMIAGYSMLFTVQAGQLAYLAFALFTMGIGAGAFKPIISATIGHITEEVQRNLAYAIYYWMINLGAFLMPLTIGFVFPVEELFYFVFLLSASLISINLVIVLTLFKSPVEPDKELSVPNALKKHVPALRDRKFIVILAIYSGFWFLYALNHTYLGVYMLDFGRMPSWFALPFLATINPGTIIVLGPILAKRIEKRKSLNVMMWGIVLFLIGLIICGFSTSSTLFVLGIITFSAAEFMVHPGFISYISKIAPTDKLAIYMSWIFIPSGMGNMVGGAVHGVIYPFFAITLLRPKMFFACLIAVGLLTLLGFIWYNRWITGEIAVREPTTMKEKGIFTKPIVGLVVLMFIPVTFAGAWSAGTDIFVGKSTQTEEGTDWSLYDSISFDLPDTTGSSTENDDSDHTFMVTQANVHNVTFTLRWQDEAPQRIGWTNNPDTFSLLVTPPNGSSVESDPTPTGTNTVRVPFPPQEDPYYNATGDWIVTVQCGNCGDQEPFINPTGLREVADNGNAWTLEGSVLFYQKSEE
jgi:dipeptide/tripeptide permease